MAVAVGVASAMPCATLYEWLLLLHILGASVWLGGLVALLALATRVLRSGDRDGVARFVGSLRFVGPVALAPSAALVLIVGIWMVLDETAWEFGQTWIWLALVVFAAAFAVGAVFLSRAAIGAERAVAAGDDAQAALMLRHWSWGIGTIVALLTVAMWDMVFKPGI
jgi:uncharacterized membrane protein